jgi:proton-dependent oligopeptide transporter, POT family
MNNLTLFGHPRGLFVLFFTEMWERFSYYGMRAILLLFMVAKVQDGSMGGMGLSDAEAGAIYGLYVSSVYLLSLPGGWLADNVLGQKKAIWYGGIIIMLGHIVLAFDAGNTIFFLGLCLVALGTGLLKPNISSIVSELYPTSDPNSGSKRDSAFAIFYMGINIGGAAGMLLVGYLGEKIGWHVGFGAAAVAMFLGLVGFRTFSEKYLVGLGALQVNNVNEATQQPKGNSAAGFFYFGLAAAILFFFKLMGYINLDNAEGLAESMGVVIVTVSFVYFAYILISGGLTADEKKKVAVLIVFFIAVAIFWAGYEQGGSSLNTFALRYTDRFIGSWEMPASWLQGLQSIFVIIFSPVFAALWLFFSRRNAEPSAPVKFSWGLLILGVGFLFMVMAAKIVAAGGKASYWFLVITYLFSVLGELCISPVGLSYYTKLSPKRYLSQLMGIWFVGASLGNLIAGLLAKFSDEKNIQNMPNNYLNVVYFVVGFGIIMMIFSKQINKWTGGVK